MDCVELANIRLFTAINCLSQIIQREEAFYLDYLFKGLQVFLHTVVRTQKGHKIARIHSIKTMKESINAGMKMDKINVCHMTWKK